MASGKCSICGETVTDPGPDSVIVCAGMECRQAVFSEEVGVKTQRPLTTNRNGHQRHAGIMRESTAANGNMATRTEGLSIGVVPFMERPVIAADRGRQTEFLTNLRSFLETVLAPDYELSDTQVGYGSPDLETVRLAACAACRGVCCNQAETHSYFQPNNLEKLVDRSDENAMEKTLAIYESYLPDESVEGSCVFHTSKGCALPREHRSQTCNSFRCPQLRNIETLSGTIAGETLFLAAVLSDELRNVQTIEVSSGG